MNNRTKSAVLTTVGYFAGLGTQLTVFPMYGITVNLTSSIELGFIFMLVSYCSNFLVLTLLSTLEKLKEK